ncbi:hypothetical protein [Pseudomonas spelaei]
MKNLVLFMLDGYESLISASCRACSMLEGVTNVYGWEVAMGNEHKRSDESEHEQPARQREEEKPQIWKHPDDGTELSERDQEFPLKP